MKIPINKAKELIHLVLQKHGYKEQEIQAISNVLMYAVIRGSSQGFPKLFGWHAEKSDQAKEPVVEETFPSVIRVDAKANNGMYATALGMQEVIAALSSQATVLAGIYNTYSSSGAIGYYTSEIAKAGYVGIMFSSADPIGGIGIQGSKKGIFGTNPLAISIPYQGDHITLDMSTAKYTWADLVEHSISGQQLEPGFAYDQDGKPTTDPKAAMQGSINTFDGAYKGLGLAFMIQILAGALVGSVYEQDDETCAYGNLLLGINPKYLAGREFVNEQIDKLISSYKGTSDSEEVLLPGEQSMQRMKDNLEKGAVEISEEMYDKINDYIT